MLDELGAAISGGSSVTVTTKLPPMLSRSGMFASLRLFPCSSDLKISSDGLQSAEVDELERAGKPADDHISFDRAKIGRITLVNRLAS